MMKAGLRKENIPLLLFYIAYSIEILILLIDKSAYINPIEGKLFQLTFLLCAIKVAMTKYTNKEWGLIVGFLVLGAVSYFATERNEIIRIVMFVAAAKGVDIKRILKYTFYVTLVGVFILMMLSAFDVLGWNYVESDFDGDGPEGVMRRYCFGLGHPNALHCMYFCLILLAVYLYFEKITYVGYALIIVSNIILYCFTESKTGVIIVMFTICTALFFKIYEKGRFQKRVYISGVFILLAMVCISILDAIYGWNALIFKYLDNFLTGRLGVAEYLGGIKSWTLFSNPNNIEFFDMGYIRLFYWYGIIPTVIYIWVIVRFIRYCSRKNDFLSYLVILVMAIYTFFEAHFVSVYIARNYMLLLFACWSEMFCVSDGKERYFYQLLRQKSKITES